MAADTVVRARIDGHVKDEATEVLGKMGLSVSDAIRMLMIRIAREKALPFEVKVPNARTVKAMQAADRGEGKRYKSCAALFKDLGI